MLPDLWFPHAWKRASIAVVIGGSAVLGFAVGAPAQAAALVAEPDGLTAEQAASAEAQRTGVPVEVTALRSEDETVVANPDGSFTSDVTAGPQRARGADGIWRDIDLTLVRRADGSVAPRVSAVGLALSGGEDEPLIRLSDGDKAMVVDWPGALPEPVLDGAVATYQEVLSGVDLRVEAGSTGYTYVLVVRSAQAAESSALAKVEMDVFGEGLTVRTASGGGLEAVDASGEAVFAGAAPVMWDSSGRAIACSSGDRLNWGYAEWLAFVEAVRAGEIA